MAGQIEQRPRGSRRKPADEIYSELVVLRLTPRQMEAARALAQREGFCPLGMYVRQLLARHIAERAAAAGAAQTEVAS